MTSKTSISIAEEEACIRDKIADTSFFGYKTHIAMNSKRLIIAAIITTEINRIAIIPKG